jgi:hypothetical protein
MMDDRQLASRLEVLEGSLPEAEMPRPLLADRSRRTRVRRIGIVAGLVAAMLVSGVAGAAAHRALTDVHGQPGIFSPGGAMACSPIQHLSPATAAEALSELGYTVTWQIEYRATNPEDSSSVTSATPPADGYIIDGVFDGDHLLLVVEVGPEAAAVPGC